MPSLRAKGLTVYTTTNSLTPGVPTHLAGDLLLLIIGSSANASVIPTHIPPLGWTLVGTGSNTAGTVRARCSIYAKVTAGSEPDPTVLLGPNGLTACHHSGFLLSIADAGLTESVDENEVPDANAVGLSLAAPSYAGSLTFLCAHHATDAASGVTESTASFALLEATDDPTGIGGFLALFDLEENGAAITATVTFIGGGTGAGIAGVGFHLLPVTVLGSFAGNLPGLSGAIEGAHGAAGTVVGLLAGPAVSISAAHGVAGAMGADLPALTSTIEAITPIRPTATLTVVTGPRATLSGG